MTEAVIVDALRSPMGRALKGQFANTRIDDIASQLIQTIIKRHPELDTNLVEDVVIGCAMPEGEQGLNVARNISFLAGLPLTCGAATVNRFCASSLTAVNLAAESIQNENGEVFFAGGIESMSHVPMGGFNPSLNERLMVEGKPAAYISMGTTAENLKREFDISREEQDQFSLNSHRKAVSSIQQGKFANEIAPIDGINFKGEPFVADTDEGPRANTSLESLGALRAAFEENGTVTAGNSSPLTDGAAMTLITSKRMAKKLKLKPRARIRSMAVAGVDPATMGLGPVGAIEKALSRAGMKLKNIDLFEINEAFAVQVLAVLKKIEIDEKQLNVNGGAIALGHPLGASGARLVTTLLHALEERDLSVGLATMCVGGGQGVATIIERV